MSVQAVQIKIVKKPLDGKKVTVLEYDMQEFLEAAVKKYEKLAAPLVDVKHSQGNASRLLPVRSATTPFVSDDQRESPAGSPGDGRVIKTRMNSQSNPVRRPQQLP